MVWSLGTSEAYLTTVHERISAFQAYLDSLVAENSGSDAAVTESLHVFLQFCGSLRRQVDQVAEDEDDFIAVLGPLLTHLRKVEVIADQMFSRGHVLAVPRALRIATTKELMRLGLLRYKPVLVLGQPQNFETYIGDLRTYLFDRRLIDLVDLDKTDDVLAVISLPYLEGTRALWQPVTMGHELAHLADAAKGITVTVGSDRWIGWDYLSDLDPDRLPDWMGWPLDLLNDIHVVLQNWVREILCDLHAVRRFGPAGFAAVSEFLVSIGAVETESFSHPPGRLRIYCMGRVLDGELGAFDRLVSSWLEFGSSTLNDSDNSDLANLLTDVIVEHYDDILAAAARLTPEPYLWSERQPLVEKLTENFVHYVPATNVGLTADIVRTEDVLNAGWLARAHQETVLDRSSRSTALVMLDRIVTKALSDLDFESLWKEAVEHLEGDTAVNVPPDTYPLGYGPLLDRDDPDLSGTLSACEIMRRLRTSYSPDGQFGRSLIVTPFTAVSAQGAALDVRLSTRFITFRRSGTPVFDSLDPRQDPRDMQEAVEKDWAGTFILHPLEMVLAATLEYLVMPADLTAQVITRSSHGRLGLLSATAVLVHPHFKGCLTLELVNLGQVPLALTPGERIAQLVFQPVSPPAAAPPQKYEYPTGPQFSRVRHDRDLNVLMAMRVIRRSLPRDWRRQ